MRLEAWHVLRRARTRALPVRGRPQLFTFAVPFSYKDFAPTELVFPTVPGVLARSRSFPAFMKALYTARFCVSLNRP